jgi:hypothetical protein
MVVRFVDEKNVKGAILQVFSDIESAKSASDDNNFTIGHDFINL